MSVAELTMLAIGLAMDAFAVSVCKGLTLCRLRLSDCLKVGLWFGIFQAVMPLCGFLLSTLFSRYVEKYGPLISFIVLSVIGIGMIKESFCDEEEKSGTSFKDMFPLAAATSIDAFAAGVPLSLYKERLMFSIIYIGVTTLLLSSLGVWIGNLFGTRYRKKSIIFGGTVLIILGLKLLLG